jgi:capsular polysaccharide transport system permease protein
MKLNQNTKIFINKFWKNRNNKQRSFIVMVLLPSLLCAIYYLFIASGLYVVESRFAVKGNQSQQFDLLSGITGISSSGGSGSDSYILQDYIGSLDIINALEPELNIREIFNRDGVDLLSRLGTSPTQEALVNYWRKRISVSYDPTTSVITLKVRAFTAQDAKNLSEQIIHQSEFLVNNLSNRAREDALAFARQEVDLAEQRVEKARLAMDAFRNHAQDLDPTQTATSKMMLIGELEAELSKAQAELDAQKSYLSKNSPAVINLINKSQALARQIQKEKDSISRDSNTQQALSGLFSDYEPLLVERTFAEKAYTSALASLEAARIEADRKHSYLATFVIPALTDYATEPNTVNSLLTIVLTSTLIWLMGLLGVGIIKEHIGWI